LTWTTAFLESQAVCLHWQVHSYALQVHPRSRSRSPVHITAQQAAANGAFNEEVQLPADPFDMGLA